ncbi:MAG TPA: hypothetical protein VK484_09555 [Ferruginibacter sp.]|nr:hypothetical protein [Ferruginibacter sp.]
MKEDLLENISDTQVYTTRTIVISTFFGGLIAGSYMIYQNFKAFGDQRKAGTTIVITVLVMLLLIASTFVPVLEQIPGIIYGIVITMVVSLLTQKYQADLILKHIKADGKIHTGGRAVLICVVALLIMAAFIFGAYFLQDAAIIET